MFSFQWIILRLSVLFVILSLIIDLEILLLISGFLIIHISLGLRTIVFDYVHIRKLNFISLILIRISLIEIMRYILELLI